MRKWKHHINKLYNSGKNSLIYQGAYEEDIDNCHYVEITKEELERNIGKLKNRKAPELDCIPNEMFR